MKNLIFFVASLTLLCASCTSSEKTDEETQNEQNQDIVINHEDSVIGEMDEETNEVDSVEQTTSINISQGQTTSSISNEKEDSVESVDSHTRVTENIVDQPEQRRTPSENEIIIYTYPPRAKVYIDNRYVGLSPCIVQKDDFNHILVVDKKGYFKIDEAVNLGGKKHLIYNLVKIDEKSRSIYDPKVDD